MIYIYEPWYFHENRINIIHALRVTAQGVARWCDTYEARVIMPRKGSKDEERIGIIPENFEERKALIDKLIEWLINNSENTDREIRLIMDSNIKGSDPKFAHYDAGQYNLNLSKDEFEKMQQTWKDNDLPEDLFYPENEALRLLKPLGFFGKFMTSWGWTWQSFELYSPKQWEEELQKNPESIKKLSRHVPL